ncbi:MFS transporter [Aquabacter spiritensis]|uniref:MHS family proline/betaine transporter-like MFS transporter n=1 Tax=Aquabacter spiritensis TaxID=933073 RepID=A0A4R3LPY8_9HYPH|nr:MFS transporter [Aquabacter spiritensis]TCT02594.1 MHS family proline/betaine transporter-like MFS transporter [Aquabacter spiritensis]
MTISALDGPRVGTDGPRATITPRMIAAGSLGNMLEWYDFAAYGFLASVFAKNFFPSADPFVGLISAFGIFAASFLMRPLGGLIFGHIGDRHGRRLALYISAGMMSVSTVAIGLLPTYGQIGAAAPLLLLALRLLQGVSIGGEYTMAAIFLGENAHARRRGAITGFAGLGATGGTLLGSAVGALTASVLTTDQLVAWGWRLPFLAGILLGGFTLLLRRSANEMPEPVAPPGQAPIVAALREDWRNILRGIALNGMLGASFYLVFVYLTTYMHQIDGLPEREALQINTVSMIVLLALAFFFSALTDRVGRKIVVVGGLAGLVLFSWPLFRLIDSSDPALILMGQIGFAVLIAAYAGPMPVVLVEMFKHKTRCTALSISYNVAAGLIGGTAPMVAVYLVNRTQNDMSPAFYLIGLAALSLAAALTLKDRTGQSLT